MIYVASTWKNDGPLLDEAHRVLRARGLRTFDFRVGGRWWKGLPETDCPTEHWNQPARVEAFERDYAGLAPSNGVLLVLPAGTDSHIEAAWASGKDKAVVVYGSPREGKYELMLRVVLKDGGIALPPEASFEDAADALWHLLRKRRPNPRRFEKGCNRHRDCSKAPIDAFHCFDLQCDLCLDEE